MGDGTCLFEQDRQFTQDISGDIELDGDNGMLFDANFAMCFIGFFFLLMHFGFTIIKCASPTSPLAKTNIICGCTALLFITISPILFAAGIESNNGVQINSVGGMALLVILETLVPLVSSPLRPSLALKPVGFLPSLLGSLSLLSLSGQQLIVFKLAHQVPRLMNKQKKIATHPL